MEIIENYSCITIYSLTCTCGQSIMMADNEYTCKGCQKAYEIHYPPWPSDVEATIYGYAKDEKVGKQNVP